MLLLALPRFGAGQNIALMRDIGVAQAEFSDALNAWMQNDPGLEKELLTADPVQMKNRVRRAADLRDRVMVKRQAYLDLMIEKVRDARAQLAPEDDREIPVADFRKDLEAQLQRVLADKTRVQESLGNVPEGENRQLLRRTLEAELTELIDVEGDIRARLGSLERLDQAQRSLRSASQGETPVQSLNRILAIWEQERAATTHQRASWVDLYKSMERAIDEHAAGRKKSVLEMPRCGNSTIFEG